MTNEQRNQVAAMNASGMSIDEIVLDTGLGKQEVADFVAERNVKRTIITTGTTKRMRYSNTGMPPCKNSATASATMKRLCWTARMSALRTVTADGSM